MTWLHVVGLIWTVVAASLAGLTAAGALHRWLHPTEPVTEEQDEAWRRGYDSACECETCQTEALLPKEPTS